MHYIAMWPRMSAGHLQPRYCNSQHTHKFHFSIRSLLPITRGCMHLNYSKAIQSQHIAHTTWRNICVHFVTTSNKNLRNQYFAPLPMIECTWYLTFIPKYRQVNSLSLMHCIYLTPLWSPYVQNQHVCPKSWSNITHLSPSTPSNIITLTRAPVLQFPVQQPWNKIQCLMWFKSYKWSLPRVKKAMAYQVFQIPHLTARTYQASSHCSGDTDTCPGNRKSLVICAGVDPTSQVVAVLYQHNDHQRLTHTCKTHGTKHIPIHMHPPWMHSLTISRILRWWKWTAIMYIMCTIKLVCWDNMTREQQESA